MKTLILCSMLFVSVISVNAQNPAGRWKYLSITTQTADGKKQDVVKDFNKEYPCLKDATIILTKDGKITGEAKDCSPEDAKASLGAFWKTPSPGKIALTVSEDDDEPVIYTLEIKGNKMYWTTRFTDGTGDKSKDIVLLEYIFTKA